MIHVLRRIEEYFTYLTAASIVVGAKKGSARKTYHLRRLLGEGPTYGRRGNNRKLDELTEAELVTGSWIIARLNRMLMDIMTRMSFLMDVFYGLRMV